MARLSRFLLTMLIAMAAPVAALAQTVEPVRPDDRTLGSAEAPVTLTVYLSTTCSHCATWHTTDFPLTGSAAAIRPVLRACGDDS